MSIHLAIINDLYDTVEEMVARGENINVQNNNGDTPLHMAVKYRRYPIIDLLLNKGADQYIKNRKFRTAYDVARIIKDKDAINSFKIFRNRMNIRSKLRRGEQILPTLLPINQSQYVVPEQPQYVVPEQPQYVVPEQPQYVVPEQPRLERRQSIHKPPREMLPKEPLQTIQFHNIGVAEPPSYVTIEQVFNYLYDDKYNIPYILQEFNTIL